MTEEIEIKNRSKLHHLNLQGWKCKGCGVQFVKEDTLRKPYSDPKAIHLHHLFTREGGVDRPKKGQREILCTICHARAHNFRYGWMRKFKNQWLKE